MLFRQLFDLDSCTYTYLLADEVSREAVLIDPVFELHDRDAALVAELGLKLLYTLDTHCHADHVTGAWLMRQKYGSRIVLSGRYKAQNVDVPVDDGDVVSFGSQRLVVRATPGHTDGCVTYVPANEDLAFTGDCLLIRGAGRTDFQAGDARRMFRSITEKIFTLPDDCLIYPAHDYAGRTVSSVREERRFNPRIGENADERDFVGYMENLGLPHPRKLAVAVPANMKCGEPDEPLPSDGWAPLTKTFGGVTEVDGTWVAEHLAEVTVVDVRNESELHEALGAISGALCIPLSELEERIDQVPRDRPVVTVCHAGKRSALAVGMLRSAGIERAANIAGGMVRWRLDGLPTV